MEKDGKKSVKSVLKKSFVQKLRTILDNKNISQKQFAEQMGKTTAQVSQILNVEHAALPTFDFLVKLKEIYTIDLNWLLSNDELQVKPALQNPHMSEIVLRNTINNDWFTPFIPGEVRYIKEELSNGMDINKFFHKMEEVEGRVYISNSFPSGLHREVKVKNNKKDSIDEERQEVLRKNPDLRNWEFYTVVSLLQFGFGRFAERFYSENTKIRILKRMMDYFKTGNKRELYFLDSSHSNQPDNFFYGFPITRLVNHDHIICTETNRYFRVERNEKRYNEILKLFTEKKDIVFLNSSNSLECIEVLRNCLINKKGNVKSFLSGLSSETREILERSYSNPF